MSERGRRKIRIGQLLLENGLITEEQLQTALAEQRKLGLKLGRTLTELGYIEEAKLGALIADQLRVPLVDLERTRLDPELVRLLPETHARRLRALVIERLDDELLVGMSDPSDVTAYDELGRLLHVRIKPAMVHESALLGALDRAYLRPDEISSLAEELHEELGESEYDLANLGDTTGAEEAPVVRLLQSLFEDASRAGASDIHIEPEERALRIRQRIDGVLHERIMSEHRIAPALVLRLKLMANIDIAEKRRPQDGRFHLKLENKNLDVRLSTMPVAHGESVVMRLLDQSDARIDLAHLGMPKQTRTRFQRMIGAPNGLVLVTGPTGSGKTTTLYAALSELNCAESKIITVEDPVEYRMPRVNQVQVNRKIELSFARVLRAALRQDPDIIMVGEMRDAETAEIGLRAAMTGHLVLSTLHTNDAISTATRLIDMGIEAYLAASALRGIIAQRLLRVICDSCSEPHDPNDRERGVVEVIRAASRAGLPEGGEFRRGAGCDRCHESGYRGRVGVYELLEFDAETTDALRHGNEREYEQAARRSPGFRPIAECALAQAAAGRTTLEELLRLMGEQGEA